MKNLLVPKTRRALLTPALVSLLSIPIHHLSADTVNVTVQVDQNGDVFIIAPQYNVAVGDDAQTKKKRKAKKDVTRPPDPTGDGTVPSNRWWLFSEDNQTEGQVVDIAVNGTTGQDVSFRRWSDHLRPGALHEHG